MYDPNAVGYGNGLIYVGIPRERMYLNAFVDNRDALLTKLAESGVSCGFFQAEGHRVDRNRDQIVHVFMAHEKKPEWLLMLDTDMEHPTEAPMRLAAWKKPIVGALYFHRGKSHDPFVFRYAGMRKDDTYDRQTHTWAPKRDLVYQFLEAQGVPMRDGAAVIDRPTSNPLVECDAIGSGCMLVHRSVFEHLPAPWFEYRPGGNSEDLIFCKEAKEAGIPVFCDISTICGHYQWVPMGQVQFRMNYVNRGLNLTAYTLGMASRWWSKMYGISTDKAIEKVKAGNAHMVGDIWRKRFKSPPTPAQVEKFYRNPEVGKAYAMELLHWNFSPTFNTMRRVLTPLREVDVLEIGSGIGSVALQLWIQRCRVLASEVNEDLRKFIDIRYEEMVEEVTGECGELSVIDDTWIEKTPDRSLDYVVSFETFEHLPWDLLKETIGAAHRKLKDGGRLIYSANFKQQDLYPMHYDYSDVFESLFDGLFERLNSMELRKV